jgi:Zn finger protein HypA/HybF involved in hydrogenase expression
LSTSSQDSFESNHDQHQASISQEYPLSIGEILHLLKHEIRDTFKTIAEDNAVNVSMIQDRFHITIYNIRCICLKYI